MKLRAPAFTRLLTGVAVAMGLVLVPAGSASAVYPSLTCTQNAVYALQSGTGVVVKVNSTTGASTATANAEFGSGNWNALAMKSAGTEVWAYDRDDNKVKVARTDHTSETYSVPKNSLGGSVVAGAINPANGIYYYASGGSTWTVFAFNTLTKTAIGQVATISGTGLGGNGDFAFDAAGNLFVVSSNDAGSGSIARVNGALPTTEGGTALGLSVLASTPSGNGTYHSMAFDSSGLIVVGTSTPKIIRVNPTSGAVVDSSGMGFAFVDLASCASPSTALIQVDLPDGRHTAGDQFTVTLTGNGLTSGNSGTTTGSDAGLQGETAEKAGPAVVLPGQSYTVTQSAAGTTSLANYATTWRCVDASGATLASGTGQTGTVTVPSAGGSTVTCTFTNSPLRPAIELTKTAGALNDVDGNGADAGDTIAYGFKVTNTGNIPLSTWSVHDPRLSGTNPNVTCPAGALAVGASGTCTGRTYTLTQADVDAGSVANTATASGTGSNGVAVSDTDSTATPVAAFPALLLDKTAAPLNDVDGNGPDAGDTVTYSFKVTNTGNVTLNPVTVNDPVFTGSSPTIQCPSGALAPGQSLTCTARSYTLVQSDVDGGKRDNTATATGTAPSGVKVTSVDTTSTALARTATIDLVKTASAINDTDGNGADAGDTVTYGFSVRNTGNTTLDPVTVHDPLLSGSSPNITCPTGALAPGATLTCTSRTYTLTQADVDNGSRTNTATATATPPGGGTVSDGASTTTPIPAGPALVLDKTAGAVADLDGNGADAGDTVTYGFSVRNTGTVTLNPVTVHDSKLSGAAPNITCPAAPLAPGATVACTSRSYTLTQADVDSGRLDNTATATGTAPGGAKVTSIDSTSTTLVATPSLLLDKTVSAIQDVDGNGADAGDTVTYGFSVRNTGTVTLNPVTVHDPLLGGTAPSVTCPTGALAPGTTVACSSATYTLTQADVDAGRRDNSATASGTAPGGAKVTSTDSTTTTIAAVADVRLVKTASAVQDVDGNGPDAGDTITYAFSVENTGTVRLSSVSVHDPLLSGAAPNVTCPSGPLDPNDSLTCTGRTYTLTQADVDRGRVENRATVTGSAPGGATVTDEDATTTPVTGTPALELTKTASSIQDVDGNGVDAGDRIEFGFTVRNTGTVVLAGLRVVDPLFADPEITCPSGNLAAGASVTCSSRSYELTLADLDRGSVDNTATATAASPSGVAVSDSDSTTTGVQAAPQGADLSIAKSVDVTSAAPGSTVTYTLTVRNDGPGSAQDVRVTDALPAGTTYVSATAPCAMGQASGTVTCDLGTLDAGETRTVTIKVTVDPLPSGDTTHQHQLDHTKVESHLSAFDDDTKTVSAQCPAGYLATDGSVRVDHVDDGTGTLADAVVLASGVTADGRGWTGTVRNDATGQVQAKVNVVCMTEQTSSGEDHAHPVVVSAPVTASQALPAGRTSVDVTCAPGTWAIAPSFSFTSGDGVVGTRRVAPETWRFTIDADAPAAVDLAVSCLAGSLGTAAGHAHDLVLREITGHVDVPAGQVVEVRLTCDGDEKGIVAWTDLAPGLVGLGTDPQPVTRVYRFLNPTGSTLGADYGLLCVDIRTAGGTGAATGGTITNTAHVSTTSADATAVDNSASASFTVNATGVTAAPRVAVVAHGARTQMVVALQSAAKGRASITLRTVGKAAGLRSGTVLAKDSTSLRKGRVQVELVATGKAGKAVRSGKVKSAELVIVVGGQRVVIQVSLR